MKCCVRQAVALILALAVSGCGAGPKAIPAGTYESIISGTHPELNGTWALTVEPEGRFRIALRGQPAVTGNYRYDGSRITFTDESGPMMCAAGATSGSYRWKLEHSQLTLTAVSDDCQGRRGILTQQPYEFRPGH